MKKLRITVFAIFSLCLISKAYSQGAFYVHGGAAFPVSHFASDDFDDEDAGAAAIGLDLGIYYVHPVSESGFGIFGGIDLTCNGLQKDYKDSLKEFYESMGSNNAEYTFCRYIGIPITAGLNYTYVADDKIRVFANGGLALNLLNITEMQIEFAGETTTTEMDLATGLGFKIGGGILINKITSISVYYLWLGNHNLNGVVSKGGSSENINGELKVDIVTVTVGVRL